MKLAYALLIIARKLSHYS
jgi:hypothetical protein